MSKIVRRCLVQLTFVSTLVATSLTQNAHGPSASDSAWSEMTASMEKMQRAMASVKHSGDSDGDFVAMMIPHHQAAIEMAKSELLNGKDPQIRRLAQEVITDQQSEIDLMQLWSKQHPPHQQ